MTKGRKYLAGAVAILLPTGLAALWIARRPDPRALPAGCFRVHVQEVIKDNYACVLQFDIEARATSYVHIDRDRPVAGVLKVRMPDPIPPDPPWWSTRWPLNQILVADRPKLGGQDQPATRLKLTVLCDRLNLGQDLLKFQMNLGCPTCGWGAFYDMGVFPKGKSMGEVISIGLDSVTYREGTPQTLIVYKGRPYRILVDAPKP